MVVDSGGAVAASYRSDLVPAVVDFWKALPKDAKVALWSTAGTSALMMTIGEVRVTPMAVLVPRALRDRGGSARRGQGRGQAQGHEAAGGPHGG
jgi:hypothetical protein